MKRVLLLSIVILALLSTMGFSCLVDNAEVSLDLVFSACYDIKPGSNTNYVGNKVVIPDSLLGEFKDKVKSARPFDIRVRVTGAFTGNVTNGIASINNIPILIYGGAWSDFATPQSLLARSSHIVSQPAGIAELVRILLLPAPRPLVVFSSTGTLTGGGVPPVPAGLGLCIEMYVQADAEAVGSSD